MMMMTTTWASCKLESVLESWAPKWNSLTFQCRLLVPNRFRTPLMCVHCFATGQWSLPVRLRPSAGQIVVFRHWTPFCCQYNYYQVLRRKRSRHEDGQRWTWVEMRKSRELKQTRTSRHGASDQARKKVKRLSKRASKQASKQTIKQESKQTSKLETNKTSEQTGKPVNLNITRDCMTRLCPRVAPCIRRPSWFVWLSSTGDGGFKERAEKKERERERQIQRGVQVGVHIVTVNTASVLMSYLVKMQMYCYI